MNALFCLKGTGLLEAARLAAGGLSGAGIHADIVTLEPSEQPGEAVVSASARRGFCMSETLLLTDDPVTAGILRDAGWYVAGILPEDGTDMVFEGTPYVFTQIDSVDPDSYVKAYERLAGLPWKILETERLSVRETTIEDVDRFYEIYEPPGMTRYMEGLFGDPEDERRYMADYIKNVYSLLGFGVWTLTLKDSGTVIGRAGFSIRNGFDNPELGFLIGEPWQRQGYATEACRAILDYGRDVLEFGRVLAFVREGNAVSVKLCESLGFKRSGELELEEKIYGDSYGGEGSRVPPGRAEYGRYILMTYDMGERYE